MSVKITHMHTTITMRYSSSAIENTEIQGIYGTPAFSLAHFARINHSSFVS